MRHATLRHTGNGHPFFPSFIETLKNEWCIGSGKQYFLARSSTHRWDRHCETECERKTLICWQYSNSEQLLCNSSGFTRYPPPVTSFLRNRKIEQNKHSEYSSKNDYKIWTNYTVRIWFKFCLSSWLSLEPSARYQWHWAYCVCKLHSILPYSSGYVRQLNQKLGKSFDFWTRVLAYFSGDPTEKGLCVDVVRIPLGRECVDENGTQRINETRNERWNRNTMCKRIWANEINMREKDKCAFGKFISN